MLLNGDCLEEFQWIEDNSVDAIVTDPPYGLSFMNKKWDHSVPSVDIWREALRVLKPGGHLLSFGGTRTYHRVACAIEDAGFEIRDQIQWIYGSGFPKSHNLPGGIGTALKPANEPIVVARKPLSEKTVAKNVELWGVGGLNIDATRIGYGNEKIDFSRVQDGNIYGGNGIYGEATQKQTTPLFKENGRWPANVMFDEAAAEMLGEPSRFFYVAKASKRERGEGNVHPTVKPIKLMEYLIKLVTPAGGTVLDPFMGSGSTGVAAKNLGFDFIGIEMNAEYFEICKKRIGVA